MNRGIRFKILSIVMVALAVGAVTGVVSVMRFNSLKTDVAVIRDEGLSPVQRLGEVRRWVLQTRVDALADEWLSSRNGTEHAAYLSDIRKVDEMFGAYAREHGKDADVADEVREFQAAWHGYTAVVGGELLARARAGDKKGYLALRDGTVKPLTVRYNNALTAMEKTQAGNAADVVVQAGSSVARGRSVVMVLLLLGTVLALAAALMVARAVESSVRKIFGVLEGLSEGDLTRTAGLESADEMGRMSAALDESLSRLREIMTAVGADARVLAEAGQNLTAVAGEIASSAEETAAQAGVVSGAADRVSGNVQTVASGAEEMTASIHEIAENTNEAASVARNAVELATGADATVGRLGESSTEIGNVTKIITSIAEQTNLLALNATIEAARAGEAGKGFAVVAGEVKDLAQETAKATQDIARLIDQIQHDSSAAVGSIRQISEVVDQISTFQTTIASAVEEQTATTNEMSRNVQEAAGGTGDIAGNIAAVATAAQSTTEGVGHAEAAIRDLAHTAEELDGLVGRFTY